MIYISFDIGVKNLAVCILKYEDTLNIIDWNIITLAETKKEIKGVDDISERIFMQLDNMMGTLREKSIDHIDYILIENQPSNLNGIMKTIQHIIFTYFSLLKHWDKIVDKVILVNASLKSKYHNFQPVIEQKESLVDAKKNSKGFKREKYKLNKESSIQICRNYIQYDEKLIAIFDSNKKKDDLCDACLQAVSYIKCNIKDDSILEKLNNIYSH